MTERLPARRKWQISSSSLLTTWALLQVLGCSAATSAIPAPHEPDAGTEGKLKAATQAHTVLAAQLAAAPREDLLNCQTTTGDCLISVTDHRNELVGLYYLNRCRDPDPEKQGPCIARELEQSGRRAELASYYETENWCSRKLVECMATLASDVAHRAARQRLQERREQIETAPKSVIVALTPEFAKEKLAFVRSTLPPQGQQACPATEPEDCADALKLPTSQFEAELGNDPPSYDSERALNLYAALQRAEADCYTPELSCLIGALPQYGATPESEKLLQQNLSLLAKQQQMRTDIEPNAAEQCLSGAVIQYSDRIVDAYRVYARDPVALAFVQLQKEFVVLHAAQLNCLSRLASQSKHR